MVQAYCTLIGLFTVCAVLAMCRCAKSCCKAAPKCNTSLMSSLICVQLLGNCTPSMRLYVCLITCPWTAPADNQAVQVAKAGLSVSLRARVLCVQRCKHYWEPILRPLRDSGMDLNLPVFVHHLGLKGRDPARKEARKLGTREALSNTAPWSMQERHERVCIVGAARVVCVYL